MGKYVDEAGRFAKAISDAIEPLNEISEYVQSVKESLNSVSIDSDRKDVASMDVIISNVLSKIESIVEKKEEIIKNIDTISSSVMQEAIEIDKRIEADEAIKRLKRMNQTNDNNYTSDDTKKNSKDKNIDMVM